MSVVFEGFHALVLRYPDANDLNPGVVDLIWPFMTMLRAPIAYCGKNKKKFKVPLEKAKKSS